MAWKKIFEQGDEGVKIRAKAALLMCLMAGALYSAAEAFRSVQPPVNAQLPKEIYERFAVRADAAEFTLRGNGRYVAVYEKSGSREPVSVTGIELRCLREADRAMIEAGIPVISRRELLLLLEDLGS